LGDLVKYGIQQIMVFDREKFLINFEKEVAGKGHGCLPRAVSLASKAVGGTGLSAEVIIHDLVELEMSDTSLRIAHMLQHEGLQARPRVVNHKNLNWLRSLKRSMKNNRGVIVVLPSDKKREWEDHALAGVEITNSGILTIEAGRFDPSGNLKMEFHAERSGVYSAERLEKEGAEVITFQAKPRPLVLGL